MLSKVEYSVPSLVFVFPVGSFILLIVNRFSRVFSFYVNLSQLLLPN